MDREKSRERYLRDDWSRQVGDLASTLARQSSRAEDERYDGVVAHLLHVRTLRVTDTYLLSLTGWYKREALIRKMKIKGKDLPDAQMTHDLKADAVN